ncbi:malate:quinone oxidoreductase [Escherichia coli]
MKKVTAMLFSMAVGLNAVSMAAKAKASEEQETDVLLIGGGIMSATLGTIYASRQPEWSMTMVERLEGVAQESSNGWNTPATGHLHHGQTELHPAKCRRQHQY